MVEAVRRVTRTRPPTRRGHRCDATPKIVHLRGAVLSGGLGKAESRSAEPGPTSRGRPDEAVAGGVSPCDPVCTYHPGSVRIVSWWGALVLAAVGCAPEAPKALELQGGEPDVARPKMDLPATEDPRTRACFETLKTRIDGPPEVCSDPAHGGRTLFSAAVAEGGRVGVRADLSGSPRRRSVPGGRLGAPIGMRGRRVPLPSGSRRPRRLPARCVRAKVGPALPPCTSPYLR